jgi:hypothetical protein
MASARPGPVGNALGSLAIAAFVALIAFGLPAIDRLLPSTRDLTAGARIAVGAGVTLVPPAGARLDLSRTRPGTQHGTALFTLGTIRYAVVAGPYTGSLADATMRQREQITARAGYQIADGDRAIRSNAGVDGRTGGYDSPGRTGEYVVFVADGRFVELTASAPDADLRTQRWAVEASARSVTFEPGS